MAIETLGDIGECIYCGATENLSEEHIVPFSLGGTWILKNASCRKCADITSSLELDVARNLWPSTRILYGIPTRRPASRPQGFPLKISTKDGKVHEMELPPEKYGAFTSFLIFEKPGHITGKQMQGINLVGHALNRNGGIDLRLLENELGSKVSQIEVSMKCKPASFARMLAKIAYGFAIAHYGKSLRGHSFVLPAILGQKEDIGTWVGTDSTNTQNPGQDFGIEVHQTGTEIHARIRFFGKLEGAVTYLIVVGEQVKRVPA